MCSRPVCSCPPTHIRGFTHFLSKTAQNPGRQSPKCDVSFTAGVGSDLQVEVPALYAQVRTFADLFCAKWRYGFSQSTIVRTMTSIW